MSDLKPCPFCEIKLVRKHIMGDKFELMAFHEESDCLFSGLTLPNDALPQWNQRPNPWRPIEEAPRDGTRILAQLGDIPKEFTHSYLSGRMFVIEHAKSIVGSNFDTGWNIFPGMGGFPDSWVKRFMLIPEFDDA